VGLLALFGSLKNFWDERNPSLFVHLKPQT
jgi:hypothetical protein